MRGFHILWHIDPHRMITLHVSSNEHKTWPTCVNALTYMSVNTRKNAVSDDPRMRSLISVRLCSFADIRQRQVDLAVVQSVSPRMSSFICSCTPAKCGKQLCRRLWLYTKRIDGQAAHNTTHGKSASNHRDLHSAAKDRQLLRRR